MICAACQGWMTPQVNKTAGMIQCPTCGHVAARRFMPLLIVSGPSGAGKTTLIPELQRLLFPEWDVFETDLLWDSGGDWNMVKCNWLRIADHLVQAGRPVILCGTMKPDETNMCDSAPLFSRIHYAALVCDPEVLVERLRARPGWRGCTEEFIAEHVNYCRWFIENAETAFDPPLLLVDTTRGTRGDAARQIADWATARWKTETRTL